MHCYLIRYDGSTFHYFVTVLRIIGISDKIGRRNVFHMFTIGSVPLFASLPYCINQVAMDPTGAMAPVYLGIFCASTVASISVLGGTFAVLPAYEADLYGPKYVQAIHGRFLIAATLSTIAGPSILLNLRKISENAAIQGNILTKFVVENKVNFLLYRKYYHARNYIFFLFCRFAEQSRSCKVPGVLRR